mmetsp:Transcript_4389/g.7833  ORF Transcript_4389/g.7833 Transcript_4389/m.7833 type:complete len:95 (-) Transcript_4389:787-1071(-)
MEQPYVSICVDLVGRGMVCHPRQVRKYQEVKRRQVEEYEESNFFGSENQFPDPIHHFIRERHHLPESLLLLRLEFPERIQMDIVVQFAVPTFGL